MQANRTSSYRIIPENYYHYMEHRDQTVEQAQQQQGYNQDIVEIASTLDDVQDEELQNEYAWAMSPPTYKEAQRVYYKENSELPTYDEAITSDMQWSSSIPYLYDEVISSDINNLQEKLIGREMVTESMEIVNRKKYDLRATDRMSDTELKEFDFVKDFADYCAALESY
jgi:predicted naringenin-chalcone synthase